MIRSLVLYRACSLWRRAAQGKTVSYISHEGECDWKGYLVKIQPQEVMFLFSGFELDTCLPYRCWCQHVYKIGLRLALVR